jgi:hypothetical protein
MREEAVLSRRGNLCILALSYIEKSCFIDIIIPEAGMRLTSKSQLLELTRAERATLEAKIKNMTREELIFPGTMGGWSVKDILQHLVDWEQRWMHWYAAGMCGEQVHTPEPGYNWRQLNLLNERYRQLNLNRPLEDVLQDFSNSYNQILGIIERIPEPEMLATGVYAWTGKYPLIVYIAGNTCEHYRWAAQMIKPNSIRKKMNALHK